MSELLEQGRADAQRISELLRPIVERFATEQQPLVVAVLERNAAGRYRDWAASADSEAERGELLACAAREEEIASTIEAMDGGNNDIAASLEPHVPELRQAYDTVFGGKDRAQQMAIQAAAERIGASVWRELAESDWGASRAEQLARCAELEEESASCLEQLLEGA